MAKRAVIPLKIAACVIPVRTMIFGFVFFLSFLFRFSFCPFLLFFALLCITALSTKVLIIVFFFGCTHTQQYVCTTAMFLLLFRRK